ncbi:ricin-type beta-trefoil lectin domain protein [Streptomyces sp. CL12]|uniref:ricin-type beta-trefoil lectin domain protein n=1 Tax=Streptomyces sp. CL12 TaxID=3391744 RepID=UPI003A81266D
MVRTSIRLPRTLVRLFALLAVVLGVLAAPAHRAEGAEPFKILAFYDGTYDAAHISFVHEANAWFPQRAAANGYAYTATNDWSRLNTAYLAKYQVVMFLDNYPQTAAQRGAFQTYMNNGGAWMGFHVSAYNDQTPSDWSWYHETFLGTGTFRSNTWGPTSETLRIEDPNHSYPIVWSNCNYKMIYDNFGHNAMDYATNTTLSSTFGSAEQNKLLLQGLRWLGGASGPVTPPPGGGSGAIKGIGGKCVDVAGANSANGTAVQLYDCNGTGAQTWSAGADGTLRALGKCMDVMAAGTANGTKVQLYGCNGTGSQVWRGGGDGSLVNPRSGKCLDATGQSSADGTRLQIWSCTGSANQTWTLPS